MPNETGTMTDTDKQSQNSESDIDDSDRDEHFDVRKYHQATKRKKECLSSSEEEAILSEYPKELWEQMERRKKSQNEAQRPGCSQWTDGSAQPTPAEQNPAGSPPSASSVDETEGEMSVPRPRITEDEMELLARQTQGMGTSEILEKGFLDSEKRRRIKETFEEHGTVPTLKQVESHFASQIAYHEEEIKKLHEMQKSWKTLAEEFWLGVKDEQAARLQAHLGEHRPRPRKRDAVSRVQRLCPLAGCGGRCINIRRHLSQCHKHLNKSDIDTLIEKYSSLQKVVQSKMPKKPPVKDSSSKQKSSKKYPSRQCSVCDKRVKRLDIHVEKKHSVKRRTNTFRDIMRQSLVLYQGTDEIETVEVASGKSTISLTDGIKSFLNHFEKYLRLCTTHTDSTTRAQRRMVNNVLTHMVQNEVLTTLSGSAICKLLVKIDDTEPLGFLPSKREMFSVGYKRKIVDACRRAVACLEWSDDELYHVEKDEARAADKRLLIITMKYQKEEIIEKGQTRRKKELENVTMEVIDKILKSDYIKNASDNAKKCLTNPEVRPLALSDFTKLRDVLILTLMIKSVRRPMEFAEFTLGEYLEMEERRTKGPEPENYYVIRVARHKTAHQGPSLLYLEESDKKVLDAYILFYRPVVTSCMAPSCLVFPNRIQMTEARCCSKITFSNLSRIVNKTAIKSTSHCKITSRILRRSQISALWEKCDDPAWRQKVAEQCCHSLATATRYYDYSSKVEPGKLVVATLRQMRDGHRNDDAHTVLEGVPGVQHKNTLSNDLDDPESVCPASREVGEQEPGDKEYFLRPTTPPQRRGETLDQQDVESVLSYSSSGEDVSILSSLGTEPPGASSSVGSVLSYFSKGDGLSGDVSVLSSLGAGESAGPSTDYIGSLSPVKLPDTANVFRDIRNAIEACNKRTGEGPVVFKWVEVKAYLDKNNSQYRKLSATQLRYKFKYLKHLKKKLHI